MVPAWVVAQLWPLVRSAPWARAMELDQSDTLRFPWESLVFSFPPYTFHSSVGFLLFCVILTLARIAAAVALAWFSMGALSRQGSIYQGLLFPAAPAGFGSVSMSSKSFVIGESESQDSWVGRELQRSSGPTPPL